MRRWLIGALVLVACKQAPSGARKVKLVEDAGAPAAAAAGEAITGDAAFVSFWTHYPSRPAAPPRIAFAALVADEPGLREASEAPAEIREPIVRLGELEDEVELFDREALERYFSRGLSAEQLDALSRPTPAIGLSFAAPAAQARAQLARAYRIAGALAERTGGVVWSDDARLAFGADAWRERAAAAAADPPGEDQMITIHAYQPADQQGVRLVTLGMLQLALPDLALEDAPRALGPTSNLILELVAQSLVEGARPDRDGVLALDVASLRHGAIRERLTRAYVDGATGKARVRLVEAARAEGDAENRLLRIEPPGAGGYHERLAATSAALFGREDEMLGAKAHDPELDAARDRARARLPDVARRFAAGLPERHSLLVKAPFRTTDGGNEYMWIEVRAWDKATIRGVLTDEPFDVPSLHAGATVEVVQAEVFDYFIGGPDGVVEGNETTEILMRREGGR